MSFKIDEKRCVGCGACAFICLFDAIGAVNSEASCYKIDENKCVECSQCSSVCPNSAINPPENFRKIKKVTIIGEKCKGCTLCNRACVAKAPEGKVKEPFVINQSKCFKCGVCATKCRFDAINVEYI